MDVIHVHQLVDQHAAPKWLPVEAVADLAVDLAADQPAVQKSLLAIHVPLHPAIADAAKRLVAADFSARSSQRRAAVIPVAQPLAMLAQQQAAAHAVRLQPLHQHQLLLLLHQHLWLIHMHT
jgi:hypothetical protein